jgi:hypothetical protein
MPRRARAAQLLQRSGDADDCNKDHIAHEDTHEYVNRLASEPHLPDTTRHAMPHQARPRYQHMQVYLSVCKDGCT